MTFFLKKGRTVHCIFSKKFGKNRSKKNLSLLGISVEYKKNLCAITKSNLIKLIKHNFYYEKSKREENNRLLIRYLSSIFSFKSSYFKI